MRVNLSGRTFRQCIRELISTKKPQTMVVASVFLRPSRSRCAAFALRPNSRSSRCVALLAFYRNSDYQPLASLHTAGASLPPLRLRRRRRRLMRRRRRASWRAAGRSRRPQASRSSRSCSSITSTRRATRSARTTRRRRCAACQVTARLSRRRWRRSGRCVLRKRGAISARG